MQSRDFLALKWLAFLVVFVCLPLPHGNIYPFTFLIIACVYCIKKYSIKLEKVDFGLVAFFCLGLLSTFWAINAPLTIKIYAKVLCILFGGHLWMSVYGHLREDQQQDIRNILFWANLVMLAALLFFVVDIGRGGRLYEVIAQHMSQAMVHAAIACSLAVWINLEKFSKLPRFCFLIVVAIILNFATSDAATLGVIVGGCVFLLYRNFPRFLRLMFVYGMPVVWFIMPFIFLLLTAEKCHQLSDSADSSYIHRLFIWNSSAEHIFERFVAGFGFGGSRFQDFGMTAGEIVINAGSCQKVLDSPVHPHNYMLQVWLELGVIGVIIACAAWIIYWNKNYKTTDVHTIAFWGSIMCIAATSISIWQSWWLFLVVTLLPVYTKKRHANMHD